MILEPVNKHLELTDELKHILTPSLHRWEKPTFAFYSLAVSLSALDTLRPWLQNCSLLITNPTLSVIDGESVCKISVLFSP